MSDWVKQATAENAIYYYNKVSGESSWDVPEGFVDKLGKDWVEVQDESGTTYYYNVASGESSWTVPEGAPEETTAENKDGGADELPEWVEVFDPSSKSYYFFNNRTQECQWDTPEGYKKPDLTKIKAMMSPELKAALLIQNTFRAKMARKNMRKQRASIAVINMGESSPTKKGGSVWQEVMDPASGYPYYFNSETGEMVWEKPAEFIEPIVEEGEEDGEEPEKEDCAKSTDGDKEQTKEKEVKTTEGDKNENEDDKPKEDKPKDESSENAKESKSEEASSDDADGLPEWVEVYDPSSEGYYYFNNFTQECSWEKPVGYKKPDLTKIKALMSPELKAALLIQGVYRAKKARRDVRKQRAAVNTQESGNESPWQELMDPSSGFPYYYNSATEEMTWEKPLELMTDAEKEAAAEKAKQDLPEWVEVFDPSTKSYYFFNNITQECTWEQPEGYKKPDLSKIKAMMSPELKAALLIQNTFRAKMARRDLRKQRANIAATNSAEGDQSGSPWQEIMDPSSGFPYYYNSVTGEMTWDKPGELEEVKDTPKDSKEEKVEGEAEPAKDADEKPKEGGAPQEPEAPKEPEKQGEKQDEKQDQEKEVVDGGKKAEDVNESSSTKIDKGEEGKKVEDVNESSTSKIEEEEGEGKKEGEPKEETEFVRTKELVEDLCEELDAEIHEPLPEWVEVYDPSSKAYYYFNNFTQACQWDQPEGYTKPDFSKIKALMSPELKAALLIQNTYRAKKARQDMRKQRAKVESSESGTVWQELHDPSTDLPYYYNRDTAEVVWDKPEELMSDDEKAQKKKQEEEEKQKEDLPTWVEVYDPSTKSYYYFNNVTFESSWDMPEGYKKPNFAIAKELMAPELKAALLIQGVYRAKKARQAVRQQRAKVSGAEDGASVWQELIDPGSGLAYFYNRETEEVTWDKPEELMTEEEKEAKKKQEEEAAKDDMPEWVEVYDPGKKLFYYFNNFTQESTWDKPEGYKKPDFSKVKAMMSPELKAALLIQNAYRAKKARQDVRKQRAKLGSGESSSVWQATEDPNSGLFYYYNSETEEVTWDKPEELMTDEEKAEKKRLEEEKAKQPKWLVAIDEESGNNYYYNTETNQVQWEKPDDFDGEGDDARAAELKKKMQMALEGKLKKLTPEMAAKMKKAREEQEKLKAGLTRRWCEVYDESVDAFYYYDVDTNETTWEKPSDFVMDASDELLRAALMIQGVYRSKLARAKTRLMRAIEATKDSPKEEPPIWVELNDNSSGLPFFFNKHTQEIVWTKPGDVGVSDLPPPISVGEPEQSQESAEGTITPSPTSVETPPSSAEDMKRFVRLREKERLAKEREKAEHLKQRQIDQKNQERKNRIKQLQAQKRAQEEEARAERLRVKLQQIAEASDRRKAKMSAEEKQNEAKAERRAKERKEQSEKARIRREEAALQEKLKLQAHLMHYKVGVEKQAEREEQTEIRTRDLFVRDHAFAAQADPLERSGKPKPGSLWDAVRLGIHDAWTLKSLIPSGTSLLDIRDPFGRTALHEAAWLGNQLMVEALLGIASQEDILVDLAQSVDTQCGLTTPLHEASRAGWSGKLIRALVEAGAMLVAKDHLGDTPLHSAARHGHSRTALALITCDETLETLHIRNYKDKTPIDLGKACLAKRSDVEAGECYLFSGASNDTLHIFEYYEKVAQQQLGHNHHHGHGQRIRRNKKKKKKARAHESFSSSYLLDMDGHNIAGRITPKKRRTQVLAPAQEQASPSNQQSFKSGTPKSVSTPKSNKSGTPKAGTTPSSPSRKSSRKIKAPAGRPPPTSTPPKPAKSPKVNLRKRKSTKTISMKDSFGY